MSIFETATRRKLRFNSAAGVLNVEQLWDLPLIAKPSSNKVDLDSVGRAIQKELRSIQEDSLVDTKPDPRRDELSLKLEVIKYIIDIKQAEADEAMKAITKREERRVLLEALDEKKTEELKSLSKEELIKRLDALG